LNATERTGEDTHPREGQKQRGDKKV